MAQETHYDINDVYFVHFINDVYFIKFISGGYSISYIDSLNYINFIDGSNFISFIDDVYIIHIIHVVDDVYFIDFINPITRNSYFCCVFWKHYCHNNAQYRLFCDHRVGQHCDRELAYHDHHSGFYEAHIYVDLHTIVLFR